MTAYKKNLLSWAVIMTVGLSAGLASLYVSAWFLVAVAAVVYIPQFFLERIVCPNCGTPVTYQGTLFGKRIRGGFIRRNCQQCGWDLNTER
jgi:RNase P subunit RPR2